MKPDNSHNNVSSKNKDGNESAMDKIADKTKDIFGANDEEKGGSGTENESQTVETPFQDTPDEGFGDVPTEDKIIKDPETGEETYIKNDNKR